MNFSIWRLFEYYLRPIVKWFLRKTTGLCELQRICYGEVSGAPRIHGVEYSLSMSNSPQIKQLVEHLNGISDNQRFNGANERELLRGAVNTVLLVKKINPIFHPQFITSFGKCIEQIWGYRQLIAQIEELRTTLYDCDNFEHERRLYTLWENLMPHDELEGKKPLW